jgi:hypothetical protein
LRWRDSLLATDLVGAAASGSIHKRLGLFGMGFVAARSAAA